MKNLEAWMNAHAKAIVSALTTMLFLYFSFRSDGLSAGDIEAIITGGLTAGGATWAIPNMPSLTNVTSDTLKIDHVVTQAPPTSGRAIDDHEAVGI